jgi:hypothetical protein
MTSNASRLGAITKELWVKWQQTKAQWNDSKAQEFESKYLLELYSTVDRTVTVIEQLDKVVNRIRKDCE